MKRFLFFSFIALLSAGFVSCTDDDDDDNVGSSSNLAGIWRVERVYDDGVWVNAEDLDMDVFLVLEKDLNYTYYFFQYDEFNTLDIESDDNEIEFGKYSVKGKSLQLYSEDDEDEDEVFTYSINGDKLTLSDNEDDFKLNLKRYSDDEFNLALEKIKICGAWMFSSDESDEYVFFLPDGEYAQATAVKDWSWGKTPLPVRKFGKWHFSDGKLYVTLGENTTILTYELDEYWVELTLKSSVAEKMYDRESTNIYNYFLWVGDE